MKPSTASLIIVIASLLLPSAQGQGSAESALVIPEVDELLRVDRSTRPSREARRNSAFVIKTEPHAVSGDHYIILTDHEDAAYLDSLKKLAAFRKGTLMRTKDLALVYQDDDEISRLRGQLRELKVRYLAIAPRMETYRENMLLGMWELITTLDDDPQLDALPGFLLASDDESFASLIDRSIKHQPRSDADFRPFAISQVPSMEELRSLQKSGILRKWFAEHGHQTPTVAVYSASAENAPRLAGDQFWSYQSENRRDFLKQFPDAATAALEEANLVVMHGHGIPGMSCGVDIAALPKDLPASVVLCGSCFSAAPQKSDFPAMRQAPGGYGVEARDAFALQAIDNGACVAFGHMRLSQGFPHLFPVLESWLQGQTVGQGYQQLINGLIQMQGRRPGQFTVTDTSSSNGRQPPQNVLLYVIIGDPALQPFEPIVK